MQSAKSIVPFLLLGLGLGLPACSAAPSDAVNVDVKEGTEPRIIGGKPSPVAEDATVFVALADGFCTGSLIAPNLVLTARHCVSQMAGNDDCQHFTTDDDPTKMQISVGATASESKTPTSAAHGIKVFHETNNSGCSYDIALIQLDHDIVGAKIAPVRFTPVTTSDIGEAIGYGDGDDKGNLTKGRYERPGVAVVAVGPASYNYVTKKGTSLPVTVSPGELLTGESTCFGDSGGPLYDAAGFVIGVTSRGIDELCIDRPSIWSDVHSHAALIHGAAVTAGHPLTGAADAGASSSSPASTGSPASPASPAPSNPAPGHVGPGVDGTSNPPTAESAVPAPSTDAAASPSSSSSGGCAAAPSSQGNRDVALFFPAIGAIVGVLARRRRH